MNTFPVGFRTYRVADIGGIRVEIDISLVLVVPVLVAWMRGGVAHRLQRAAVDVLWPHPVPPVALGPGTLWLFGAVATLGILASLLVHEFGHAAVGRRVGAEPVAVTLWVLGGGVRFDRRADGRGPELATLLAGPATSAALGGVLYALLAVVPPDRTGVALLVGSLAAVNAAVAGASLLPTFPLDGAFLLRWLLSGSVPLEVANRVVGAVGRVVALGIVVSNLLVPEILVLALFGVYCYVATIAESKTTATELFLGGTPVSALVARRREPLRAVDTVETALRRVRDERDPAAGSDSDFPVVDETGGLVGVVPARRVLERGPSGGPQSRRIAEIMSDDFVAVSADRPAFEALELLRRGPTHVVVLDADGDPVGAVTRTGFLRSMELLERIAGHPRTTWP